MDKIKLFRELAKRFPKSIKSRGDRIGLMTGKLPEDINYILLCLDFDAFVLEMVKKMDKKPDSPAACSSRPTTAPAATPPASTC